MKSTDWDKMGSLCDDLHFDGSAFEEFETSIPFIAEYIKENAPKTEYTIKEASIEDEIASVIVHYNFINGYVIVRDALQTTMKNMLGMALTGSISEDDMTDVYNQYMSAAIVEAKEKLGEFSDVGAALNRNHTTAISSVSRIENLLKTDANFAGELRDIESNITNTIDLV